MARVPAAVVHGEVQVEEVGRQEEQHAQGQDQHDRVQDQLLAKLEPAADDVRVGIARQQHHLEKHTAGVPDLGGAAELRQDHLADERLDQEQDERTHKERDGVYVQGQESTSGACGRGRLDEEKRVLTGK